MLCNYFRDRKTVHKSLNIPKGVLRRTDNTMTNEKDKKRKYGQQNTTQTTND